MQKFYKSRSYLHIFYRMLNFKRALNVLIIRTLTLNILKWMDKREVIILSTIHSGETVTLTKRGKEVVKPKMVTD
jgi:hypothetical protein